MGKLLYITAIFFACFYSIPAGAQNFISIGSKSTGFDYTDTQDASQHAWSFTGHYPNEIIYILTLTKKMEIQISACSEGWSGSEVALKLLSQNGDIIASNEDGSGDRIHSTLVPGFYYIVSASKGIQEYITTSVEGILAYAPIGDNFTNPIVTGTYGDNFTYGDTQDTEFFMNTFEYSSTNDVFYKFTLSKAMEVVINHCGSQVAYTFASLLSSTGNILTAKSFTNFNCQVSNEQESIVMLLPAGTYYLVSEGSSANGYIKTNIRGYLHYGGLITSEKQNYILSVSPTVEASVISRLGINESLQTIQYFDGLGRPVQVVERGITPNKQDLINYQEYDAVGRQGRTWLPATSTGNGAFTSLDALKTTANTLYPGDNRPFTEPEYEASPLNRMMNQYGPGQDWKTSNKPVATNYLSNTATGDLSCAYYLVSGAGDATQLKKSGNYAPNQLYVTQLKDENGNIAYEFKNKLQQVVLTRQMNAGVAHDTYYVYDDLGNQSFVLSPLASDALKADNTAWTEANNEALRHYAYLYKYDDRNRCIRKKLPGADWIHYVYDKADRLIFSQDGEQRAKKPAEWTFSIPDVFGRMVLTGICKDAATITNANYNTKLVRAEYDGTATYLGYKLTDITLNVNTDKILTANYYDNYKYRSLAGSNKAELAYVADAAYGVRYGVDASTFEHKGLLTGVVVAQLDASYSKLYSAMYYDSRKRLIQSKSTNHMGGIEKEYMAYNFVGQPTKRQHIHEAPGKTTQTEYYTYEYDHAGRLSKTKHQWKEGTAAAKPEVVLAENKYDELGRLIKNIKNNQANLTTNYTYNIRSWTKSITGNLFKQNLYYNESYGGSVKQYNGNVSAIDWWITADKTRGYAFSYDNLSRLTAANYLENALANTNYKVTYSYDKHGNMKTLQRYGKTSAGSTYGIIDNLTINHTGNQLLKVSETIANNAMAESTDFKKYSNLATEYTYNANGAMSQDLNKGISGIQYNLLNLPQVTDIKSPVAEARNEYTYSANGTKLRVVQKWNKNYSTNPVIGSAVSPSLLTETKTTDYAGNVIYENNVLKRILIEGGYIEGGVYYFYLQDHLGNNRVVANASGTVIQKNHYYPFGMTFAETPILEQGKQPYKYNDKEYDSMHGLNMYDYGARFLNSALPSFDTADPLAEMNYSLSPYVYAANNPIRNIDRDGRLQIDSVGNIITEVAKNAQVQSLPIGEIMLEFIEVTIFSNEGKPLSAKMIKSGKDKNGNSLSMDDISANCLGFSMANGALWIDDDNTIATILNEYKNLGTGEKGFEQIGFMKDVMVGLDFTTGTPGKDKNFAHMSRVTTDVTNNSLLYPQKDSYHARTTGKSIEDVLNFRGDAASNNYSPSMLVYYQANNKIVNRPNGNTIIKTGLSIFNK